MTAGRDCLLTAPPLASDDAACCMLLAGTKTSSHMRSRPHGREGQQDGYRNGRGHGDGYQQRDGFNRPAEVGIPEIGSIHRSACCRRSWNTCCPSVSCMACRTPLPPYHGKACTCRRTACVSSKHVHSTDARRCRGTVASVRPFGVFVRSQTLPRDGLVHASQIDDQIELSKDDPDDAKIQALTWAAQPGSQARRFARACARSRPRC